MSEQNILTLDEAKKAIKHERWDSQGTYNIGRDPFWQGKADGLESALNILAGVEQPSEEDVAVLWLIRKKNWLISFGDGEWLQYSGLPFNPTEEARKLGWGG